MEPTKEKTKQLFETKQVEKGIFTLVKTDENVRIAVKNQIVTDNQFNSFEDAETYIESKPWDLLLITCHLFGKHLDNFMQNFQENDNTNNNNNNNN